MITEVLPLIIFTTFAGAAAGAYAVDALCGNGKPAAAADGSKGVQAGKGAAWLFPLVCVILLGIGLCGTLAHLGQPLRFMNGMSNPASGISQESYWAIGMGLVMVVDLVLSWKSGKTNRVVRWVGGAVACGFMIVTGLAYFDCLGLVAWRGAATIPMFVVGDIALGAALCAVLYRCEGWVRGLLVPANVAAAIAFVVTLVAYALYLGQNGMESTALLATSGVLVLAGAAVAAVARTGKCPAQTAAVLVVLLVFVGVIIARYVFFLLGVSA